MVYAAVTSSYLPFHAVSPSRHCQSPPRRPLPNPFPTATSLPPFTAVAPAACVSYSERRGRRSGVWLARVFLPVSPLTKHIELAPAKEQRSSSPAQAPRVGFGTHFRPTPSPGSLMPGSSRLHWTSCSGEGDQLQKAIGSLITPDTILRSHTPPPRCPSLRLRPSSRSGPGC